MYLGTDSTCLLASGMQIGARRRGYLMLLASAEGDPAGEQAYLELFRANAVDGALVVGVSIAADGIGAAMAGVSRSC